MWRSSAIWDRLFEQIKKDKGKLDIVFANAGIAKYAPLGTIDEEHFDSIFSRSCPACVLRSDLV